MTQEDKQLLLVDICGRLPYLTKVKCPLDDEPYTLLSINWNKEIVIIGFEIDRMYVTSKQKLVDIKPYLRPMSSMTKDEKKEYNDLLLNTQVSEIYFPDCEDMIPLFNWLNKNMFDYRELIPRGCAIAVTKDNNPYED